MAGDIFFTDRRAWSSNSTGFVDMLMRAIAKCRADEDALIRIFADAADLRCLGINLRKDRNLQCVLTERILEAARDTLQELRRNPAIGSHDIKIVEELVVVAQAHLTELRGDSA